MPKLCRAIEVKDVKHAIFEALLVYIYTEKIKFKENEYRNIFGKLLTIIFEMEIMQKGTGLLSDLYF